jgi:hypothetical protein
MDLLNPQPTPPLITRPTAPPQPTISTAPTTITDAVKFCVAVVHDELLIFGDGFDAYVDPSDGGIQYIASPRQLFAFDKCRPCTASLLPNGDGERGSKCDVAF